MKMNDVEKEILKYCLDKYKPMKTLYDKVPRATAHRWVNSLVKDGHLEKKGSVYKTTPKGRSTLTEDETDMDWDILEKEIQHLKYITNNTQRCLIELVLPSMVARRDEILINHHPTFVLFGPTYKGKTWIVEVICHILGLDPIKHIHKTMAESGNSTFFRKGPHGKLVWKSEILESPLVCFDEYHKAKEKVRNNNWLYIQGEIYIRVEDMSLKIKPVSILIYNPKKGEEIGDRIKYEPQHKRRSIICDFSHVHIDEKERKNGEKILKKIQDIPPLTLPPHKSDCERYRDLIFTFLPDCVKDDSDFIIDCDMVLMLCAGMTAFLPEKKAVLVVLHRYLTIIETLGYLKENWRELLDKQVKIILNGEGEAKIGEGHEVPEQTKAPDYSFSLPIDLDYELGIQMIKRFLDEAEVSVTEFSNFLEQYLILKPKGYDFPKLNSITDAFNPFEIDIAISGIRKYGDLDSAIKKLETKLNQDLPLEITNLEGKVQNLRVRIDKLGSNPEQIGSLLEIQNQLDDVGIDIDDLNHYLTTYKELDMMGLNTHQARLLAKEIERNGKDEKSIQTIFQCINSYGSMENALRKERKAIQDSKYYHEMIENGIEIEEVKLKEIKKKNNILEQKCLSLEERVKVASDRITSLQEQTIQEERKAREILSIKDESIDTEEALNIKKRKIEELDGKITMLKSECSNLQDELEEIFCIKDDGINTKEALKIMKKEKEQIASEISLLKSDRDKFREDFREEKELVQGWREFLFTGQISRYDLVINDMERLISISRGEMPYLKVFEKSMADNVQKRLIELFLDKHKNDYIPKWEHDLEIKKALRIIDKYEGRYEELKKQMDKS